MEPIYSGKVREIYDISDKHLVIVTTDRISAFDHILPVLIKNKGIVLNKLSSFWFDKTKDIVLNHIIDDRVENMPSFFHNEFFRERTVMVEKLNMLPFEFVVRGYVYGSMWKAYE
ncbi:MAG: phosphoribosylaminoimidazolesuccinocarboxamide synthase, partial [Lachnospiraceae bacterium]|nr:phosphoribosylaminoimidazolesuccinocarboxamide synthase [Lachnospiraceae bacterium]